MIIVKQQQYEMPLKHTPPQAAVLNKLFRAAGKLAKAKAKLAAEEEGLKRQFEAVRPALQKENGLHETYTLRGPGGAVVVTLGEEYVLKDKFTDPEALRRRLRELEAPDLLDLFEIKAKPDQRRVKEMLNGVLRKIGDLREKTPGISLRGPNG